MLIVKFWCAYILHITTQPKVLDALERIRYIRMHPHRFERVFIPTLICFMKLIVEILTEIVCLACTANQPRSIDVVCNYVALACIADLDEVYYKTIREPLKEQLEDIEYQVPI